MFGVSVSSACPKHQRMTLSGLLFWLLLAGAALAEEAAVGGQDVARQLYGPTHWIAPIDGCCRLRVAPILGIWVRIRLRMDVGCGAGNCFALLRPRLLPRLISNTSRGST